MRGSPKIAPEVLFEALDALNDGITIHGPDERPRYYNAASKRRFPTLLGDLESGLSYRDAVRNAVERSLPGAPKEQIDELAAKAAESYHNGRPFTALSEDGRTYQITILPMKDGGRAVISVDVTELKARERELKEARQAAEAASASKSAFLANMSHEVRTPLNGVLGVAQVMANTELTERQREYTAAIIDSGKTLMALLNDVLDLSKIEAGKLEVAPAPTDIAHLMRRQLRLWRPRADEKGLKLTLALDSELPDFLMIDATRVQQCVSNLVSNAIKFTESGGVDILARAAPLDDGDTLLEVTVSDTGAGITEETLAKLFQPFVQADETIQRSHGGSGLGLSITRRLAELMGGEVRAVSEPERGSKFFVSFRASPAERVERRGVRRGGESGGEGGRLSGMRVLVVDDNAINRMIVRHLLEPLKVETAEAENGKEALEALSRVGFDLVLLDMHMPIMDGPTMIRVLRESGEAYAGIPVIALTADAMSGDRERYLAMGIDGYVAKPLDERVLLVEMARVAAARATTEEPASKAG